MDGLAGTDECDEWNLHGNFLAQEMNAYPKWSANTAVTLGTIYAGDTSYAVQVTTAGTTGSSSPTWPTTPGGTVTSGTAVFTTLATPARYDPLIYIFSPQHASIKDNYVEYGPYVASETTAGNSDQLTVDGMWGGDADPPYWVHFEGGVANISNVWAYNPAANTTYTNDISVVASNSCAIIGNSFSKSGTGIYSRCSGSTGAGIISGNKISGSAIGINIGGNTTVTGNYVGGNRGIAVNGTNNFIGPNAFVNTGSDGGMVYCFSQSNLIFGSTYDPTCAATTNNLLTGSTLGLSFTNIGYSGYITNTAVSGSFTPSLTAQVGENWAWNAGSPDTGCNSLGAGGATTLTSKLSLTLCGGSGSNKYLRLRNGTTDLMYVSGSGLPGYQQTASALTATGSTATIAPLTPVVHVGGTGTITTITAPSSFTSTTAGCIMLIPNNVWTTATGGNVANAIQAIVNIPVNACWDGTSWYMSTTPAIPLSGTTGSIGGSALTAGNCASGTAIVTGSTTSMVASASPVTYPGDQFTIKSYVSAAGTVTVKVCTNLVAGGTPTARRRA